MVEFAGYLLYNKKEKLKEQRIVMILSYSYFKYVSKYQDKRGVL